MPSKIQEKSQYKSSEALKSLPKEFISYAGIGACQIKLPSQLSLSNSLNEILVFARSVNATDVHLSPGTPIVFRKYTELSPQTEELLTDKRIEEIVSEGFPKETVGQFVESGDLEFVHVIEGAGRFRVTLMKQRYGVDITVRVIPLSISSFESLGLPASCKHLTKWSQGLVLVTGPAGCGKSATLSTLIDLVNEERYDHIITIEQPIEMIYTSKKCQITQREIHSHTLSQANALRAALREDPDIIVINELRDLESVQLAVTAAETGHLVFGTMNTTDAAQTIANLIDSFPADDQGTIANMISESLRGIICQQLIPTANKTGVVPAYEVLMVNSAVSSMIRERKITQITNTISMGKSFGMVLFDNSLQDLLSKGMISVEEARKRAINPQTFQ
ncbi:MAG: PilT/PilU family type 4a pilus ATPase [Candidatus Omnitrophica bacterium]|nr:PilT/PilU family type 4a pilus ATPase [Candidatus Omnitrophota bacterium]